MENTSTADESFSDDETIYLPEPMVFTWTLENVKIKLFNYLCYLGEIVSYGFGLEDSSFQDVADSMTKDEWKIAWEVNELREKQEIAYQASLQAEKMEENNKDTKDNQK